MIRREFIRNTMIGIAGVLVGAGLVRRARFITLMVGRAGIDQFLNTPELERYAQMVVALAKPLGGNCRLVYHNQDGLYNPWMKTYKVPPPLFVVDSIS